MDVKTDRKEIDAERKQNLRNLIELSLPWQGYKAKILGDAVYEIRCKKVGTLVESVVFGTCIHGILLLTVL